MEKNRHFQRKFDNNIIDRLEFENINEKLRQKKKIFHEQLDENKIDQLKNERILEESKIDENYIFLKIKILYCFSKGKKFNNNSFFTHAHRRYSSFSDDLVFLLPLSRIKYKSQAYP